MTVGILNRQLIGIGISPGFAVGKAYVNNDILKRNYKLYSIEGQGIEKEYARVEHAFAEVLNDLETLSKRVEYELAPGFADIFRTHRTILSDSSLLKEIRAELEKERGNAEDVVKNVFMRYRDKFYTLDNELLRERGDDMVDLAKRILRSLMGVQHLLQTLPSDTVLVTQRFLPSEAVLLSNKDIAAIIVEYCGTASHAAILARGVGVPVVSGIANVKTIIKNGDEVFVDGISGRVIVNPDTWQRNHFREKARNYVHFLEKSRQSCSRPAITRKGTRIVVMANIGGREEAILAARNGADGIGLFRLEQYFFTRKRLPNDKELFSTLHSSLSLMKESLVTVRLLDTGADKKLPYLKYSHEENPMLGRRGVRFLLSHSKLLLSQIEALLRLAQEYPIRILVPMVTIAEDMKAVRNIAETVAARIGGDKIPPLGAMIETPAAALCVSEIAEFADFFSIGTNDLTQYVMAAGREDEFISNYYIEDHPAVIRLIQQVCRDVDVDKVEVCGELAGNLKAIPILMEMGIHTLSVLPLHVPVIKELIRSL